jgi:hypothetical protein
VPRKHFTLLWRRRGHGFRASDFHDHCDGQANILTLIEGTNGNIFRGFTVVEWDSRNRTNAETPKGSATQTFAIP